MNTEPARPAPSEMTLVAATDFLRIYFHPATEGGRYADLVIRQLAALRQALDETTAERDALRAGAADSAAGDLPHRLHTGADLVYAAGAIRTSTALHATAHRLEHLPPDVLDTLTRHVLHGPPAATDTEQELPTP